MISQTPQRPSALNAFLKGAGSGLFSGVVMAGVIFALTAVIPALGAMHLASAALMIFAPALFGGIMSAKRVVFDAPHSSHTRSGDIVPVPVSLGASPAITPVIAYADSAPEQASKSWAAETGRSEGANSRIQQILADGSMSDKDRASAILASREAADQQASRA